MTPSLATHDIRPRRNLAPLAGYGLAAAVSGCVWALLLTSLL